MSTTTNKLFTFNVNSTNKTENDKIFAEKEKLSADKQKILKKKREELEFYKLWFFWSLVVLSILFFWCLLMATIYLVYKSNYIY